MAARRSRCNDFNVQINERRAAVRRGAFVTVLRASTQLGVQVAQYLWIQQFGPRGDADSTRANFQATLDYFVTWKPPEGVSMVHLWMALDLGRAFSLWEADDPLKVAIASANFLPFGAIETIPVGEGEPMIAAMVAGGLMQFPDST